MSASRPAEETEVHTRILRCTLAAAESQAYWEHADLSEPAERRNLRAFEERWFGSKSQARVRQLLANLSARYDAHPAALATLRAWRGMSVTTRRLVCHWHLQFSDPIYRRFTGELLLERRDSLRATVDRDHVSRWVDQLGAGRWGAATRIAFASKLLGTALEAGLVDGRRDPRKLVFPRVEDDALAYLLRFLQSVQFHGTLIDNPYLASVGLSGSFLDQRLRALPGLSYRRLGDVVDLEWDGPPPIATQGASPA